MFYNANYYFFCCAVPTVIHNIIYAKKVVVDIEILIPLSCVTVAVH